MTLDFKIFRLHLELTIIHFQVCRCVFIVSDASHKSGHIYRKITHSNDFRIYVKPSLILEAYNKK